MRPTTGLIILLLLGGTASGCIGTTRDFYGFQPALEYRNPAVFPGNYSHTDQNGSYVLQRGFLPYGDPEIIRLRSPRAASVVPNQVSENEGAVWISMAVWRPIDGFLNETIPIIVDAGPYFEIDTYCPVPGQTPCRDPKPLTIGIPSQLTGFLLKNYLPHGYAVVQLAVRGTGSSGGCMELMGPNEAADLNMAINWLAQQEWSNGNVSMIGVSYDGSTPWMVAAMGNEHLKAIIPIAGLPDVFELMFRNGTAETRADTIHASYWTYGIDRSNVPAPVRNNPTLMSLVNRSVPHPHANGRTQAQDRQNLLCPEVVEGLAMAQYSIAQGDRGAQHSDFWTQRDYRKRVLQNYQGSVFLVHGLLDFNVDPYVAIPFNQRLRDAGIDVREWYGQWGHTTPDGGSGPPAMVGCRKDIHRFMINACRYDFAEVLFRYLNYHLKGNLSSEMAPAVQIQDNRGYWRIEDSFPPLDAEWVRFHPTVQGRLATVAGAANDVILLPPPHAAVEDAARLARQRSAHGPVHWLEVKSEPFPEDTRISGLPRLHLQFEAQGSGGFLAAWLFDETEAGEVADVMFYCGGTSPDPRCDPPRLPKHASAFGFLPIIGHAQMDLRFHAGGETRQTLQPGARYTARMEFEPMDVLIPKGHRLTMWLLQYPYPDKEQSPQPTPVKLWLGASNSFLEVPTITVDPRDIFTAPGSPFPRERDYARFYTEKPDFDQVVAPIQPPTACASAIARFLAAC